MPNLTVHSGSHSPALFSHFAEYAFNRFLKAGAGSFIASESIASGMPRQSLSKK